MDRLDGRRFLFSDLCRDPDPDYRPSAEFARAFDTDYETLDRPLVPLLNALLRRGVIPQYSCAGHLDDTQQPRGYLTLRGMDSRTVAVARLITRALRGSLEIGRYSRPTLPTMGPFCGIRFGRTDPTPATLATDDHRLRRAARLLRGGSVALAPEDAGLRDLVEETARLVDALDWSRFALIVVVNDRGRQPTSEGRGGVRLVVGSRPYKWAARCATGTELQAHVRWERAAALNGLRDAARGDVSSA